MYKILVLGAGLIGGPIATDLSNEKNFEVTAADINQKLLNKLGTKIHKINIDLSIQHNVREIIKDKDIIVNALPGFIGYATFQTVIKSKKNVVDLAFYEEDPFTIDELAKQNNITALVDCGVSPGISNLLIGRAVSKISYIENIQIFVGGLPLNPDNRLKYKTVFSVTDLLEEYVRPVRLIENGKLKIKPPLSDIEQIEFAGAGLLEAFNSDGLRTLITTTKAKNMKEKTLRYPGHAEKILLLKDAGFLDKEEFMIKGVAVSPFEITAKVLSKSLALGKNDRDFTILRVIVEGKNNRAKIKLTYDLLDKFDEQTKTHSMARTTGFMASMCVRLIASGIFSKKGIFPPEILGKDEKASEFILSGLKQKGISIERNYEEFQI
ncbi:saccharopine dehydrogenase C-terminal domain-containing protein [Melioribacteraceae bacterium 4301-Me]|uniref:saccharopine dehydrogenase family protein n=1 Tax=Pyranulibacter aquaticus TaxID=3163344 RepID=UPI0035972482